MKIVFIYTNINGLHAESYAFGLASIVSVARKNGHDAKVILVKEKASYGKVFEEIVDFKPQVVGFTCVSSQFVFVKEIAACIKERLPGAIIVCGGVHPTINPGCVLEARHLDAIFVGEAEHSFAEFLIKVERGQDYRSVENLAYALGSDVIMNKLKPLIADLDSLPYPDKEIYPFKDTLDQTGYAPFFFSRGCPFLCSYCSNHMIAKRYGLKHNNPRYRSPESSIVEIEEAVKKFDIKTIWILDDIFGIDKKWRSEFCAKYKNRVGIKFICILRVNVIDDEFMKLLKDAGCFRVFIGIESGNDHVRRNIMNRHMTNDQIIKAFEAAHDNHLATIAINMIGLPGETEEMLWDTIRLNRQIKPQMSCVNIFYPYRGTRLGDECFQKGLVNESLYADFSNERRETVLNYPDDYKKKLMYYQENWEALVYPGDLKKRITRVLRKTYLWGYLRKLKNTFSLRFKKMDSRVS
ncbi:MAG: radical SAM protein [Candidatus Omnitrophota bacterium]